MSDPWRVAEIERLRAENAELIQSVSDLRAVREQLGGDALADERAHSHRLAADLWWVAGLASRATDPETLAALPRMVQDVCAQALAAHQARRGDA